MHAVLFVYQRAFTPELIIQRPVRIRVGTPEFLRIVLTRPVVFFYRLPTKTPLPQPHVRSGRHYGNLLPSSPIAAILRKAGYTAMCTGFVNTSRHIGSNHGWMRNSAVLQELCAGNLDCWRVTITRFRAHRWGR